MKEQHRSQMFAGRVAVGRVGLGWEGMNRLIISQTMAESLLPALLLVYLGPKIDHWM